METVKVRTKQRPREVIEVSPHEAEVLRGQGCLVEDKPQKAATGQDKEK
jgi:hypothetical protein